jgi:hypothetical protein
LFCDLAGGIDVDLRRLAATKAKMRASREYITGTQLSKPASYLLLPPAPTASKYPASTIKKPDIYRYESPTPKTETKDSNKCYNCGSLKYFANICPKPKKPRVVDIRELEEEAVTEGIDISESENSDA